MIEPTRLNLHDWAGTLKRHHSSRPTGFAGRPIRLPAGMMTGWPTGMRPGCDWDAARFEDVLANGACCRLIAAVPSEKC